MAMEGKRMDDTKKLRGHPHRLKVYDCSDCDHCRHVRMRSWEYDIYGLKNYKHKETTPKI